MLTGALKSYFTTGGTCIHTLPFSFIYINNIPFFFSFNKILFFILSTTILIYSNKIILLTSFFSLIYIILNPSIFSLIIIFINIHFIINNKILFTSSHNNIIFTSLITITITFISITFTSFYYSTNIIYRTFLSKSYFI